MSAQNATPTDDPAIRVLRTILHMRGMNVKQLAVQAGTSYAATRNLISGHGKHLKTRLAIESFFCCAIWSSIEEFLERHENHDISQTKP